MISNVNNRTDRERILHTLIAALSCPIEIIDMAKRRDRIHVTLKNSYERDFKPGDLLLGTTRQEIGTFVSFFGNDYVVIRPVGCDYEQKWTNEGWYKILNVPPEVLFIGDDYLRYKALCKAIDDEYNIISYLDSLKDEDTWVIALRRRFQDPYKTIEVPRLWTQAKDIKRAAKRFVKKLDVSPVKET